MQSSADCISSGHKRRLSSAKSSAKLNSDTTRGRSAAFLLVYQGSECSLESMRREERGLPGNSAGGEARFCAKLDGKCLEVWCLAHASICAPIFVAPRVQGEWCSAIWLYEVRSYALICQSDGHEREEGAKMRVESLQPLQVRMGASELSAKADWTPGKWTLQSRRDSSQWRYMQGVITW
jgi:hypothetical protein